MYFLKRFFSANLILESLMPSPISVFLSLQLAIVLPAYGQDSSYIFRDEHRPSYSKIVTAMKLEELLQSSKPQIIDVRLIEDFNQDPTLIPGAIYMNPDNIESWSQLLDQEIPVIVYCVAGKWVSQKAANYLSEAGFNVNSLEGGLAAWKNKEE